MTTATLDLEKSLMPAPPPARGQFLVPAYACTAIAAPILALAAMIWLSILQPFIQQEIPEWQAYLICVPPILAAVACGLFGALLLVLRQRWMMYACAACGIVLAAAYIVPALILRDALPLDWRSVACMLAVPALLLAAIKPAIAQLRAAPSKASLEFGSVLSVVGDLVYTKMGLLALFFWLLWFDFCFSIMETVMSPILQFRLVNELNMDPFFYAVFLTTIPTVINLVLVPVISIKSDRHRGPRGRRIPFLLYGARWSASALH